MSNSRDAERFADAMATFYNDDLLWRLTRRDSYGLQRLREAVQIDGFDTAIKIIQVLMNGRWSEPKYAAALRTCVRELWAVRELVEQLTAAIFTGSVRGASQLKVLTDFGVAIARATPDEQHGPDGALSWPRRW